MTSPLAYMLREIAEEIGVPVEDIATVAQIELIEPDEYDPVEEKVSSAGREALLVHFRGGRDPA